MSRQGKPTQNTALILSYSKNDWNHFPVWPLGFMGIMTPPLWGSIWILDQEQRRLVGGDMGGRAHCNGQNGTNLTKYIFHMFDTVTKIPFQLLQWARPPIAPPTSLLWQRMPIHMTLMQMTQMYFLDNTQTRETLVNLQFNAMLSVTVTHSPECLETLLRHSMQNTATSGITQGDRARVYPILLQSTDCTGVISTD